MTQTIDELAADIRAQALSGYPWNVPATFSEASLHARMHWRIRAMEQLDEQRTGSPGFIAALRAEMEIVG